MMVNLDALSETLDQLSHFFSEVTTSPTTNITDKESAAYGLETVREMNQLVKDYRRKPSNTILKRIHASLHSVTRGVEGFIDLPVNDVFKEKTRAVYGIVKELELHIKW